MSDAAPQISLQENQSNAEKTVLDVINTVVRKWVIEDFQAQKTYPLEDDDDGRPKVRNAVEQLDRPSNLSFQIAAIDNDIVAENILFASTALGRADLNRKIRELTELEQLLRKVEKSFPRTDLADEKKITSLTEVEKLEDKVIAGMGLAYALPATLRVALSAISKELRYLRAKLAEFDSSLGRPKNQAAHKVARAAADFYISYRGLMPTYSEDANGLHGEFTPLLKDIFIALGWPNIALRGPIEAAIASITPEVFERLRYPFKNHEYD